MASVLYCWLWIASISLLLFAVAEGYSYGPYLYVIRNMGNPDLYLTMDSNGNLMCQQRSIDNFYSENGAQISDRQLWYYPPGNLITNLVPQSNGAVAYLSSDGGGRAVVSSSPTNWILEFNNSIALSDTNLAGHVLAIHGDTNDLNVYVDQAAGNTNKYQKWQKIPFPDPLLLQKSFYIAYSSNPSFVFQPSVSSDGSLVGFSSPGTVFSGIVLAKKSEDLNRGIFQRWIVRGKDSDNPLSVVMACAPSISLDISQMYSTGDRDLIVWTYHNFGNSAPWETFNSEPFRSRTTGNITSSYNGPWAVTLDSSYGDLGTSIRAKSGQPDKKDLWTIIPSPSVEITDPTVKFGPYTIESVAYPGFFVTLVPPTQPHLLDNQLFPSLNVTLMQPPQVMIQPDVTNITTPGTFQQWYYYPGIQAFKPVANEAGSIDIWGGDQFIRASHGYSGWNQRFIYDPDALDGEGGGIYCPSFSRYWTASANSGGSGGIQIVIKDIPPGQVVPSLCQWKIKLVPQPLSPPSLPPPPPQRSWCTSTESDIPPPPMPTSTTAPIPPATILSCSCGPTV